MSQFRTNGGLLFAGPGNRDLYKTNSHYFSPRFGFAWRPAALGTKTVVRGGTGVFFFSIGETGVIQTGFSQATLVVPTLNSFLTPNATLSNAFPTGIEQPTGSRLGLATFLGGVSALLLQIRRMPTPCAGTLTSRGNCEFFNLFNHAIFNAPERSPNSSNFGKITSQANLPRIVQMALRLTW